MNIYKHEFKKNLRSVISWSFWITLLLFVMMSVFSTIADEMDMFNTIMENYPKELRVAFGMDGIDMAAVLGFFGFAFLFAQIFASLQAANYGFSLVSVEERDLTADFLLAKPVSRVKILTSKLLAALTNLAIFNVVIWIVSFVVITLFKGEKTYETKTLVLLLVSITFLQLFFLSVGLLITLFMRKVRTITPLSMGLVFGMYLLSAFGGNLGEDKFDYLTPFKHFDANYIIKNSAYNGTLVLVSVAVIVLSIAGSYALYRRRDIHSV